MSGKQIKKVRITDLKHLYTKENVRKINTKRDEFLGKFFKVLCYTRGRNKGLPILDQRGKLQFVTDKNYGRVKARLLKNNKKEYVWIDKANYKKLKENKFVADSNWRQMQFTVETPRMRKWIRKYVIPNESLKNNLE